MASRPGDAARELGRDRERHFGPAVSQHPGEVARVLHRVDDEVLAGRDRLHKRAALLRAVAVIHCQRHVAHVVGDGVADDDELQHRGHGEERQRPAVAPELLELFPDHREQSFHRTSLSSWSQLLPKAPGARQQKEGSEPGQDERRAPQHVPANRFQVDPRTITR